MTRPTEKFSSYFNEFDNTPHHDDGDFLPPEYDNPVKSVRSLEKPEVHDHATFYSQLVTMQNGTEYRVVNSTIPEKYADNSSDIANVETTAWTTQIEGMNKRRMHALARLSMPTIFVSVQQNLANIGHLDQNAHNELQILQEFAERYDYSDEHNIGNGISRGGMTTLSTAAIASKHNMDQIYTDSIVPCFPYGLDLRRDLAAYSKFLPNEGSSLAAIKDIPFPALRHYPNTVDHSIKGIFQQLKEVPSLLSGEVGRQVQENMSTDQFAYVSAYEGDVMSQGSRWKEMLDSKKYPNIIVDLINGGGHMSCVSNDCHTDWVDRVSTIAEILHENPDNRNIGGTALRALAAERNSVFLQPTERANELEAYRLQKSLESF